MSLILEAFQKKKFKIYSIKQMNKVYAHICQNETGKTAHGAENP